VQLTPAEMSHVRAIPGWTEARDAVRNNPQINWRVEHLPDNSVGFLNAVKKHFDQAAENSGSKFNPGRNKEVQSSNEMAASAGRQIGEAKSAEYQIALEIHAKAKSNSWIPLLQGPLGKLAKKDTTTQKAIDALFPENPVPGTEGEIRNAVFAMARQRPAVQKQLGSRSCRNGVQRSRAGSSGRCQSVRGREVRKGSIAGNAQQRENLQAAIEALPNGHGALAGL
jgi:hypothetical protein